MHWFFQIRVSGLERSASRILQVLETQRVLPLRFEAQQCLGAMHIQFTVLADAEQSHRIGELLRRAHSVAWVHWLEMSTSGDEDRLWQRTAFACWSNTDTDIDLDPCSAWWQSAPSTLLLTDNSGLRVSGHDTEVRMRWTASNLYVFFDCAFEQSHMRTGDPLRTQPTPRLWEHDVAEIFLGRGAESTQRYAEFEVSPRGEWIDLDITAQDGTIISTGPLHSAFTAAASLRKTDRRWRAFLRIPFDLPVIGGTTDLRLNLFRSQGPTPKELAWQPTQHASFHVPSRFGYLELLPA